MLSYYSAIVLIVFVSIPWISSVPISQFYPTEGGLTVNSDDGFSLPVRGHNNKKIPFFGNSYDFIVVNANGLLSFGTYYNTVWEPHLFPKRLDASVKKHAVLAPFFADINVVRGGRIQYRQYRFSPDNLAILHRATTDVKLYFPYARDFECKMLLVATWFDVLPFCDRYCYSNANTFQVVFATNFTWSFAFFNYANGGVRWGSFIKQGTTYHAVAGYDAADNIHYHNITGSLTSAIANIDFRTNVGVLGKFAFHVDNNVDNAPQPCEGDVVCKNGGTCTPSTRACECTKGWEGHYCESDVDECKENKGGCSQACANSPGSYMCTCMQGYALGVTTHNCSDVNECLDQNGGCSHLCDNNEGSYTCQCHPGFVLADDGFNCADINECAEDNGGCTARCINVPGSYACTCEQDHIWASENKSCIPRNVYFSCEPECYNGGFCVSEGTCQCPENWAGDRCELDFDECGVDNGGCEQICTNTIGSFNCTCNAGFELAYDRRTCNDIDECTLGEHHCEQLCHNEPGNYSCACLDGFLLHSNAMECVDINECSADNGNCEELCVNLPGSYTCACGTGKELNADRMTCTVVDSCMINNGGCEHFCEKGGRCSCLTGYNLAPDGKHCMDVDECKIRSGGCSHLCHNLPGSFACLCRAGFHLRNDSKTCENGDPCSVDNGGCDQICSPGGTCSCISGYILDSDAKRCNDIDECIGVHGCEHECINSPGSFTCSCKSGWALGDDGTSCQVDDKCVVNNGGCHHFCTNSRCSCLKGFELSLEDGKQCNDIDECKVRNGGCASNQICDNIPGSFRCICPQGTVLGEDNVTCTSSDPCSFNKGGCEHLCVGGGTCQCYPGYKLAGDKQSCNDIDECVTTSHECAHQCINTLGSFVCACDDGWELDEDGKTCEVADSCIVNNGECDHFCSKGICSCLQGFRLNEDDTTCDDIDECKVRNGGCGLDQICLNIPGGLECLCEPGKKLNNATNTCESTDPCDFNNGGCDQICIKGGTCSCLAGYRLENSTSCIDIDECRRSNGGCQSVCSNLPGSYVCSCESGFKLHNNGRSCLKQPIEDPCAVNNGGCQHICGSGGLCSCFPGFTLAPNYKNCSFDAKVSTIDIKSVDNCSACLSVSWSKPTLPHITGSPFTLFYEVNCAEVKGRGKVIVITESLKLRMTGLNYTTEYRCFVTPITSNGRGIPSTTALSLTGKPLVGAIRGEGDDVLSKILKEYIVFPIIGFLIFIIIFCVILLCVVCICCSPSNWSNYDVSNAERKCSVILDPTDQYLLTPPISLNPIPKNTKRCHSQKNAKRNNAMIPAESSTDEHTPPSDSY